MGIGNAVAAMAKAIDGELFGHVGFCSKESIRGRAVWSVDSCYITFMTVTLTPEQMRWIEAAVAAGQFSSVEEAVRLAVADFILASEPDDLSWTKPYIDEARKDVAKGNVVDGDDFLERLEQGIGALRSR